MHEEKSGGGACMACTCPCEMHKEHNHPVEGPGAVKACEACETERAEGNTCENCV